jgi:hypothetical protein
VLAYLGEDAACLDLDEASSSSGRHGHGSGGPHAHGSGGRDSGTCDGHSAGSVTGDSLDGGAGSVSARGTRNAGGGVPPGSAGGSSARQDHSTAQSSRALSPEAWRALRYAMARLAVDLVSGPGGIAAVLRRGLLGDPYNSKSVVLDVGLSDSIPPAIRKAVRLRAKGACEWPGCRRRAAWCDVHHLVHQRDGGETSVINCALLCQFHHDVCIHRWGWRLVLHPDATTTAYGPRGQVLDSHAPPREQQGEHGPPGAGPPGRGPSGGWAA